MVITVGGIKGGSGKSTLATHLAALYAAEGGRVILIDADKQATSSDFHQLRALNASLPRFTCVQKHGTGVLAAARELADISDVVIVDAGHHDSGSVRAALLAADVAWFPVVPQPFDMWTIEPLISLLHEVRQVNSGLRAFSYMNRVEYRSQLAQSTRAALAEYAASGLTFSGVEVARRVAFVLASGLGMTVQEQRMRDRKAIDEMDALFAAVVKSTQFTHSPQEETNASPA